MLLHQETVKRGQRPQRLGRPTKSDLFTRAWQIRRNQPYRKFASCLSIAWGEAKCKHFYNWVHLPLELRYPDPLQSIKDIKQAMFLLQMKTRMGPAGFKQMDAYAQEIRQLEQMLSREPQRALCESRNSENR